eukprot:6458724-Amphidinium_carterae.5
MACRSGVDGNATGRQPLGAPKGTEEGLYTWGAAGGGAIAGLGGVAVRWYNTTIQVATPMHSTVVQDEHRKEKSSLWQLSGFLVMFSTKLQVVMI